MAGQSADSKALLDRFAFTSLLNSDQHGRRIILQGTVDQQPALLLAERAAFSTSSEHLAAVSTRLSHIQNLGDNDVYHWYLANSSASSGSGNSSSDMDGNRHQHEGESSPVPPPPPDLKLNLICPATEKHIQKYSFQQARVVLETAQVYEQYVRPYMQQCRDQGRLNWVFNILDGRAEQEAVLYRSPAHTPDHHAFLLAPDLNWDRVTRSSLHLLALPQRRDLWSVRDLRKADLPWLRQLRSTLAEIISSTLYPDVEEDMLKFYLHYQPTYYHFHVHVVHVDLDATGTQAVGKALGLDHVISQLENMAGGEGAGMHQLDFSYTVGENSELWQQIFLPIKENKKPSVGHA